MSSYIEQSFTIHHDEIDDRYNDVELRLVDDGLTVYIKQDDDAIFVSRNMLAAALATWDRGLDGD